VRTSRIFDQGRHGITGLFPVVPRDTANTRCVVISRMGPPPRSFAANAH
jgi:hypothetical protein